MKLGIPDAGKRDMTSIPLRRAGDVEEAAGKNPLIYYENGSINILKVLFSFLHLHTQITLLGTHWR